MKEANFLLHEMANGDRRSPCVYQSEERGLTHNGTRQGSSWETQFIKKMHGTYFLFRKITIKPFYDQASSYPESTLHNAV